MFEHLYVLDGRNHSILRVDPGDGTVETVTDETGYMPDGIVTTPDRIYCCLLHTSPSPRDRG